MSVLVQTPPRTLMEVYKMLPEGTRAELIDNNLYMPPSPVGGHQSTAAELFGNIFIHLKKAGKGKALFSPMDVYLDETSNAVQPDIIVLLEEQLGIFHKEGHIHGVPAILIEILSKGNRDHDLIRKKDLYERFGVQEYHVVDPDTKLVLSFSLAEGAYSTVSEQIGSLYSPLLEATFTF